MQLQQKNSANAIGLFFLLFAGLSLMKFRVSGIPLSDIVVLALSVVAFVKTGAFRFSPFSLIMFWFIGLCISISVFQGSFEGILSSSKLVIPLFAILSFWKLSKRLDLNDLCRLARGVLLYGVLTQFFIVLLFYSHVAESFFNVVLPGNIGRENTGFAINVFTVPFVGLHRFGGLFIEPSWFAMFYGFFLLMYFFLTKQTKNNVRKRDDFLIIFAFIATLSFTGLIVLLLAYLYRYLDFRKPIRLIISIPLLIIFLSWLLATNEYLSHRLYLIASGNDSSLNARLFASFEKTWFLLEYTSFLGAGPAETLKLINQFFDENLSIQNAYLQAFAASGLFGGMLFILVMHFSFFKSQSLVLQIPLMLALCISSIIFTPILWLLAFFTYQVSNAIEIKQTSTAF